MKLSFSFVNAKVRGMRSSLYEGERLLELRRLPSIGEFVRKILPDQPVTNTLELERSLVIDHVRECLRVSGFLYGTSAEFFRWLLLRYVLENLKVILRSGFSGEREDATRALLADLPPPLALPLDQLVARRAAPEAVLAAIARNGIRELLAPAVAAANGNPFVLESALDANYLRCLIERACGLGRRNRRGALELVSCEADTANVMLALRAGLSFDLEADAVSQFFVEGGARLGRDTWLTLVGEPDVARGARLLRVDLPDDASLADLEWALARNLYRLARRTFRTSIHDFGVVAAFFYIKRAELADLLQVVGAFTYDLSADELGARLITGGDV